MRLTTQASRSLALGTTARRKPIRRAPPSCGSTKELSRAKKKINAASIALAAADKDLARARAGVPVAFSTGWGHTTLQQELLRQTGQTMSLSEIGRTLRCGGLRPHRVRIWLHSPDPDFQSKAKAICDLYPHLRVRRRADLLVLESGPSNAPWPHARFRRETVHLWRLEFPTQTGSWETTPFRDQLARLLDTLINDFPWTLSNES
jgi:hypothetical protein